MSTSPKEGLLIACLHVEQTRHRSLEAALPPESFKQTPYREHPNVDLPKAPGGSRYLSHLAGRCRDIENPEPESLGERPGEHANPTQFSPLR